MEFKENVIVKWLAVVMFAGLITLGTGTANAAEPAVLGGGSGITVSDSAGNPKVECTLTTIGHDASGALVGLTAGHCAQPGDLVSAEAAPGAGVLGTVRVTNPAYDYAVIAFDASRVIPVNRIGGTTITAIGAPATFPTTVCKDGRSTGNSCGVAFGDVLRTQQTFAQLCVDAGDSGAPVVAGTMLVGMVNAYVGVPCFGPALGTNMVSIAQQLSSAGGIGAGFVPVG